MPGGITAQYGFLYQRYVFIKLVLENAGMNNFFVYEGADDIDISEENRLSTIKVSDSTYAQIKSGTVSRDCWAKVIGNWLLIDDINPSYRIILENNLAFDIASEEIVSNVCNYFMDGATKKSTSIANKVYKKYIEGKEESFDNFKHRIVDLLTNVSCDVCSLDSVYQSIEETFKTIYCQDIKLYEAAKLCRCERFVEYINADIDNAIAKKKGFVLRYNDLTNTILKVTTEIGDKIYRVNIGEIKKRKIPEAEALVNDNSLREIRQLRLVNSDSGFIVNELFREMLYRDFREVYLFSDSTMISNIEETAYSNFEDAMYSLPEGTKPKELFDSTVSKYIPLSIVDNSPLYQHGCYTFLTSDDTDENRQITWGKEHE